MPRNVEVDNSQDILDSRDIVARLEELRGEREALVEAVAEAEADAAATDRTALNAAQDALADWLVDNGAELAALEALNKEGEGYGDWSHGETLIRDSYFKDYAEELAYDIGAINKDARWPLNHIDWDAAADALKVDYTELDFDGVTYWMRA